MKRGRQPDNGTSPSATAVTNYTHVQVREGGANPIYVGGETEIQTAYMPGVMNLPVSTSYETSFWEIHCEKQDGKGDGTVPVSSGKAPRTAGSSNIRQQFALTGFSHEPAYRNPTAQCVTHYAITKIVNKAKAIA